MSLPWSSISELLGARGRRGWVCNGREGPCEISLVLFSGCGAWPEGAHPLRDAPSGREVCWGLVLGAGCCNQLGEPLPGSGWPPQAPRRQRSSEAWPPASLKTELPRSKISFWRRHFCSHPCLGGGRANQILVCSYESCR